jgi:hypothetical protein
MPSFMDLNTRSGVTEAIVVDIARQHAKALVFVGALNGCRKAERIAAFGRDRGVQVVNTVGSEDFGRELELFCQIVSGVLVVSVARFEGWATTADATVFVDADLAIDSAYYAQLLNRNRNLPDPVFVNCVLSGIGTARAGATNISATAQPMFKLVGTVEQGWMDLYGSMSLSVLQGEENRLGQDAEVRRTENGNQWRYESAKAEYKVVQELIKKRLAQQ